MQHWQTVLSVPRPMVAIAASALWTMLATACLTFCSGAYGGYVVAVGDYTPSSYLLSPVEEDSGTVRFFNNLQPGNTTALLGDSASGWNAHLYQHYNTGGRTASFHVGEVTDQSLSSVELAVVLAPSRAFSVAEAQAIGRLLARGGSLLAFMDASQSAGLPFVADLLDKLNVELENVPTIVDSGPQAAVGSRIATHPLTEGVDSFRYGATSLISGGVPLFLTTGGQPLVAAVFVPEPASALMFALSGMVVTLAARSRLGHRPLSAVRCHDRSWIEA